MASVFWEGKYSEKGAIITGSFYVDEIRRFQEAIKEKRRGKLRAGVLLHQDNAAAQKATVAMRFNWCNTLSIRLIYLQ